jgi:hypothetical protein
VPTNDICFFFRFLFFGESDVSCDFVFGMIKIHAKTNKIAFLLEQVESLVAHVRYFFSADSAKYIIVCLGLLIRNTF